MATPELIQAFLSQATASGSKSSALQPLVWLAGILTTGLGLAASGNPPKWVVMCLAILLGATTLVYLGSYLYYAIKSPDSLRSEKFTLSKMAIEKNLIGDDKVGLLEVSDFAEVEHSKVLPNQADGE